MAAVMRAMTLKAGGTGVAALVDYYAGLAEDQLRRDGLSRGPIDYYLDPNEPPGRWWGEGCPAIELSGDVRPEQLEAMMHGRHPGDGRHLGRGFGAKSARAFDATFSAPKSVSVLWALSPDPSVRAEVLAAHDAAVVAALDWFQEHGGVTRRGTDGVHQVDAQGLVAALFRQHTSREADPQLHTHAVIWGKVRDPTGKWLSLDARFLKYQQRSIGWVYAAALRSELSARRGVSWGQISEGHADIDGVPAALLKLFSQRNVQVETTLATSVAAWVDDHDGADPDPRTLYRLERDAVVASRPGKSEPIEAERLRAEWAERANHGFAPLAVADSPERQPGAIIWDEETVIAEALVAVASSSSTWLRADLAREIAARLPADVASSATEVVGVVDRLSAEAAGRCVELHPPATPGVACRRDGRAVTEHVVDRRLSAPAVLDQEARLLAWAAANAGTKRRVAAGEDLQAAAAQAVAGERRLVLVVGPAGTGKTTMLASAVGSLREQRRAVVGLAPSGKAADVLGRETGTPATTLAKLLYEHGRPEGPPPEWQLRPGTTVILDEAGMASTEDLARLVDLADRRHWRLACVGDPAQLPAVGRGGMFAHWSESFPAHHLEEVRRFHDAWQGEASLLLRRGDPAAAAHYAEHERLRTVHPALQADRVARQYEQMSGGGATVAVTTASTGTARAINVEIQGRRNPRRQGRSVALADGTEVFVGAQVATRRNDASVVTSRGTAVRNRHTWTVTAIGV
ncbi:MAG TPA: MobF family relaxase, partial [Acidimicrobiales bacterium]|nr:MobF family relaxase [Acidimicrobiales bacterium]